jgi:hypothetical protein
VSADLVAFLRARLDDDERVACAATEGDGWQTQRPLSGRWTPGDGVPGSGSVEDETGDIVVYDEGSPSEAQAAHIARHDPARVLREVEAKRRIVDLHAGPHECSTYDHRGDVDACTWVIEPEECSTLRLLASVYDQHPDYREEWRP